MLAQLLARRLAVSALAAGAFLVGVGLINRYFFERMPWVGSVAVFAGIGAVVLTLLPLLVEDHGVVHVARTIDRLARTRDRFVTALTLPSDVAGSAEMRALALTECERFVGGRDFRRSLPWRFPREIPFLLVPAVALLMLQWDARLVFTERAQERAEARARLEPTAAKLEELARDVEKKSGQTHADELKRIAEQLRNGANELRAGATTREQAEKAAMLRLSELEELVQQMQTAPANVSKEEINELAKALAQNEATKDAAAAMQAGNMAEAAKQLEKSAQQNDPSAEKVREALREALRRLAEKRPLSDSLQRLAEQLQKSAATGSVPGEALQRLAQMLKQMRQGTGDAAPSTRQALNNLLSALQNLKFGEGNDREEKSRDEKQSSGAPQILVQSFAPSDRESGLKSGDATVPTGLPGSDRDEGTTATAFGEKGKFEVEKGSNIQLKGRLGEGETLSAPLPSGGDASKATRRYKELYEALAPAAQDAVVQENIPLGSRFFIKRYFEAIRPRD